MFTIGSFSQLSGLSIKALRNYHAEGLLVPAVIDTGNGYRRYTAEQLRPAVLIRTLRDAGMPLADIRRVLDSPDADAAAVLAEHHDRVAEWRAEQDKALAQAHELLAHSDGGITVDVSERDPQPYIGRVLNSADEQQLTSLFDRLQKAAIAVTGPWWMTTRDHEGSDSVEVVCCWPVAELPAVEWLQPGDETGVLPARQELVCSWAPDRGTDDRSAALVMARLSEVLTAHGIDPDASELRQSLDAMAGRASIAVTISTPSHA